MAKTVSFATTDDVLCNNWAAAEHQNTLHQRGIIMLIFSALRSWNYSLWLLQAQPLQQRRLTGKTTGCTKCYNTTCATTLFRKKKANSVVQQSAPPCFSIDLKSRSWTNWTLKLYLVCFIHQNSNHRIIASSKWENAFQSEDIILIDPSVCIRLFGLFSMRAL